MSLQAILFDVDGTLADTEPHGHLPAYNHAFKELGLDWCWETKLYRELLKQPGGRERVHHYIDHHGPGLGDHQDSHKDDPHGFVNQLHAIKSRHFLSLVQKGLVPLRPGVRRLMLEARAEGIRLAIVTNATRPSLNSFLRHTLGPDLQSQIEHIVSGEDVVNKKPFPDLYKLALSRLDIDPKFCVAIEDSEMGLKAATSAGIRTLVTINDDTAHQDFSQASAVISDLGEPDSAFDVISGPLDGHQHVTPSLLRMFVR